MRRYKTFHQKKLLNVKIKDMKMKFHNLLKIGGENFLILFMLLHNVEGCNSKLKNWCRRRNVPSSHSNLLVLI